MPIGPYDDFAGCQEAQIHKGKSKSSAKKICGKLYWKTHGKKKGMELLKEDFNDIKKELKGFMIKYGK